MPSAIKQPCANTSCPELVRSGLCDTCKKAKIKVSRQKEPRGSSTARGYGSNWRKLRKMILASNPMCVAEGCNEPATDVDHIIPKAKGGRDEYDNLQGLCRSCHSKKTAKECKRGWKPTGKKYVVCGSPCSGKSTWVNERRNPGDLVFDWDEIASVVLGRNNHDWRREDASVISYLRSSICDYLKDNHIDADVYFIVCMKDSAQKIAEEIDGEVISMKATQDEAYQRLTESGRDDKTKKEHHRLIGLWYAQPSLLG